jgi:hypothetical protein
MVGFTNFVPQCCMDRFTVFWNMSSDVLVTVYGCRPTDSRFTVSMAQLMRWMFQSAGVGPHMSVLQCMAVAGPQVAGLKCRSGAGPHISGLLCKVHGWSRATGSRFTLHVWSLDTDDRFTV